MIKTHFYKILKIILLFSQLCKTLTQLSINSTSYACIIEILIKVIFYFIKMYFDYNISQY